MRITSFSSGRNIGVWANFFVGGSAIFARKIFRQHPKNCYVNLQNCLADSPHPIITRKKIQDFGHFISLDE